MSTFGRKATVEDSEVDTVGLVSEEIAPARLARRAVGSGINANADAQDVIRGLVLTRIDPITAIHMTKPKLTGFVETMVTEIANENGLLLNQSEPDSQ